MIPALWCENQLVKQPRPLVQITIDACILEQAKMVREAASESVETGNGSAALIEATLNSNQKVYKSIDKMWRVEESFWTSVLGDGAGNRLKEEVRACLPSDQEEKTMDDSLKDLASLGKSKLLEFAGLGLQASFRSVVAFVTAVEGNRKPSYDGEKDSALMKTVMEKCALWCIFCPASSSASGGQPSTQHGSDAVKSIMKQVQAKMDETPLAATLADLTLLHVFGWLSDDERCTVNTWTNEIVKLDVMDAAAKATSKGAGKGSGSKGGRKRVGPDARAMVLALATNS